MATMAPIPFPTRGLLAVIRASAGFECPFSTRVLLTRSQSHHLLAFTIPPAVVCTSTWEQRHGPVRLDRRSISGCRRRASRHSQLSEHRPGRVHCRVRGGPGEPSPVPAALDRHDSHLTPDGLGLGCIPQDPRRPGITAQGFALQVVQGSIHPV